MTVAPRLDPPAPPGSRRRRAPVALLVAATAAATLGLAPAAFAATAGGGPGTGSTWNETGGVQGFATAVGSASKVWYTLGNGGLENVFYPQTDNPDTYGLQYYVTDGSSFTDSESANTAHAVALADPTSLTWQQTNTSSTHHYTLTKTYVADPARSVILVQTTFANTGSTPLRLYADYLPQLNNQGMGNSGGTDPGGDLVAVNGAVASALSASTGFTQSTTGYVGTAGSGAAQLAASHALTATYTGTSSSGHLDQTAQIPVGATGSTSFTLALAFDTSQASAVADAAASQSSGFAAVEASFESGWHGWNAGLHAAPASVTGNAALLNEYYVSLMEVKADEDKNYPGAFVASPTTPWGGSTSADSPGGHGYHLVWTRDEYEMATALLAAGDTADAGAALTYLFGYEETSSGQVKQNTWLNGDAMWGGNQQDEEADPIILAYQLGRTGSADFADIKLLANYIGGNGPYTGQERWEENSGYSPSTIATEIAGLVCASSIATANGDSSDASAWLAKAQSWASSVDSWTYTTNGPYGNGSYFLRLTPDQQPDAGASIGLANGGGSHDDRTVVDQGFLELVRFGIKAAAATDIANSLAVTDAQIGVRTPEGLIDHRYDFDGYGETASGGDYTGAGVGQPWPVLTGERGEYDVANGDPAGAQAALATMQGAATPGGQLSEQVWGGGTGTGGFTFGAADDSASPLMWTMAQYVRLAVDISAGTDVDTPAAVCQTFGHCVTPPVKPTTPTGLAVTGTNATTASLSWTGVTGASGYYVLRNGATVGTTPGTAYTDTGLASSTYYTYTVEAYNGAGTSAASSAVTATTTAPSTPPSVPAGLAVTATTSSTVSLSWNASTDTTGAVAGYYVYRNAATTPTGTVTGGTAYTDTGLAASTSYTYKVAAYDTQGDVSALSGGVVATTGPAVSGVSETFTVSGAPAASPVYLSGSISALGDWAPASALAMTQSGGTWTVTVSGLPASTAVQYKYIEKDAGGNVTWEPGNNMSLTTAATGSAGVSDTWTGSTSTYTVGITAYATTVYGQNVYIAGSIPALGSWNTNDAVALSSASYPYWTGSLALPPTTYFEYKYIKKDGSGDVIWESGANRSFTTGASGSITFDDTWH